MSQSESLSLSALAKVLGRAKSGLHRMAKNGQIPRLSDGKYDLAAVQIALKANVDPARAKTVHTSAGERSHVNSPPAGEHPADVISRQDAADAVSLIQRVLEEEGAATGAIDFNAARTAEVILKTRERALRMEIESGRLVDRSAMQSAVFKLSREDRDSWTNWPSRVGPLMAARLGVDSVKLIVLLEEYVRLQLAERSRPALLGGGDR